MALTTDTAHCGSTVRIHRVRCHPHDHACGPVEHAAADLLVLPLRGLFVKHHERGERIVADPCHALFFKAGEPYRVSHPVDGGDECLVLEPSAGLRSEIAFRAKVAGLDARLIAVRKLLSHRLERGLANALEAEEGALALLCGVAPVPSPRESLPRRARSRHAEMVEATKIALARHPARGWTLGELAKRVYSSPFHLARTFRRVAGMPLHRYHLRARMAAALDEVLDTSRDLTTVALDLGFSSHSHFTASFRATFGVTPSSLRNAGREVSKVLTAR